MALIHLSLTWNVSKILISAKPYRPREVVVKELYGHLGHWQSKCFLLQGPYRIGTNICVYLKDIFEIDANAISFNLNWT